MLPDAGVGARSGDTGAGGADVVGVVTVGGGLAGIGGMTAGLAAVATGGGVAGGRMTGGVVAVVFTGLPCTSVVNIAGVVWPQ